jgi:hypothetical protein
MEKLRDFIGLLKWDFFGDIVDFTMNRIIFNTNLMLGCIGTTQNGSMAVMA